MPAPTTATPNGDCAIFAYLRRLWTVGCGSAPGLRVRLDALAVDPARLARAFLPGEHADGHDGLVPVADAEPAEGAEELVPVHLALPDVQVLVYPGGRPGRVDDVAQPRGRPVVERVGHVQVGQQIPGVAHHPGDVPAHVEGVRRAVEERDQLRVDAADQVDRGLPVLDEVVRVRLES